MQENRLLRFLPRIVGRTYLRPQRMAYEFQQRTGLGSFDLIGSVAENLGFRVRYEALPDTVNGFLIVNDGVSCICLNRRDDPHTQAFTIAHELGHHELGHRGCSSGWVDAKEIQASQFALSLLLFTGGRGAYERYIAKNQDPQVWLTQMAPFFLGGAALVTLIAGLFSDAP